jgi:hypothetical protein
MRSCPGPRLGRVISERQQQLDLDLPAGALEAQLDAWVGSFPVESIRQHLRELERRKGTIEAAIESLSRRLNMWQAMRAHSAGHGDLTERPSKRDAVLTLLERDPTREFSLTEIRGFLIEGGMLDNTPKARHALEATVSNMTKRGEILRPRKGHYIVAPSGTEQATRLTNLQRKEGEAA